jgi:hypothetical protein
MRFIFTEKVESSGEKLAYLIEQNENSIVRQDAHGS